MNNQKISGREMKYVIALFLVGSSTVAGAAMKTGNNSWIHLILSAAFFIPLLLLYNAILQLYPGKNLFDIVICIFGNVFGKIICFIYVLYAVHLSSLVINIFSEFIHMVNMPETPVIIIKGGLSLLCIYMVYSGISSMGRLSKFLFPLLVFSVILTFLTSIKIMDVNNLKPVLLTNYTSLLSNSYTVLTLSFGEIILFTSIFSCVDSKTNYKKTLLCGFILGFILLLIANLRNILILGPVTVKIFPFPSYEAISIIALGEFFTRIEVVIGANLLLAGFIKVVVCCFSSCQGMAKIMNIKEYKYLAAPLVLIMLTLSSFAFKNSIDMLNFIDSYKIYVIPFQFILPGIILIAGIIKNKIEQSKQQHFDEGVEEDIY